MFKSKYLHMAILVAIGTGSATFANAADDAEVAALRAEVATLKQMVQELSNKQAAAASAQPAVMMSNTAAAAPAAPPARTKDGWAVLPDGKTSAKLYGFIRADMIHDFEGAPPEKFSDLDKQPLDSTHPVKNKTQFTVKTTRIGVDFKTPTDYGDVAGKVEGDFWGDASTGAGNSFRFRHAYLTWNNWLFGHTWSPIVSLEALPETVDFNTLSGGSLRRRPQVRYTYNFDKSNTLAVAAEEASSDARFPVLSAKYEHKFDNDLGLVNVRAAVHEKRGEVNTATHRVDEKTGYVAAVGGMLNITPQTKVVGQYFHAKGDGGFVYGTGTGYTIDTTAHDIYMDELDSAVLGLTHKFNPKLRSTVALSWVGFKDDTDFALYAKNATANKELKQASINLFYNPVPSLTFGGEYTYGEREVFSGDEGKQSRINLMARYNF